MGNNLTTTGHMSRYGGDKMMKTNDEKAQAHQDLLKILGNNNKVYTILKHVSSSGMSRHIDVVVIQDSKPKNINWYIEKLGLYKRAKSFDTKNANSLRVSGCGMNMGFDVVYNLSTTLYPNGYKCQGEICHSNDHFNDHTCEKIKSKHHHRDGGYALKQEWL